MRRHDQHRTRRMSDHVLRNAPDQYMFQTRQSMSRCNDQIDIVIFCKSTDIQYRRAFRKDRLKLDATEVYRLHKPSHFALGIFPGGLLQTGNVVDGSAFA